MHRSHVATMVWDKQDADSKVAGKLFAVATELLAVARRLEAIPSTDGAIQPEPANAHSETDYGFLAELAREAYEDRRRRSAIFRNSMLFGEPGWDILLDLFIAASERKTISVTSACIGAAVPSTTALRWLKVLETEGLVVREHDPNDNRRINVRLTASAFGKMCDYFRNSSRPQKPVGWIADREPRCATKYWPAA